MLVVENDASITLVCRICGGPILPGQPFINREDHPIHSESEDCRLDEGWNPHIDTE